jgi:exodeoxyribonuclease VII large subunit
MRVQRAGGTLREAAARILSKRSESLDGLGDRLDAVSPLGTLRRGYAIVERDDGRVVTLARELCAGDPLVVRLQDGRLQVHVDAKEVA